MRNLKRALSLALASVMLLGMMVVGASAASYPDVDENDNVEAIDVLNAISVMIGRQGNFAPDAAVNRHEMATIMAKLVLGNEIADNYVGTHPYTDVVPWADKYVAACYENGLTSGTSATTYGGTAPLTAVQAAAMMLRALGYKDLSKGATDWRAPVTAMANQIRLFDGVASNPSEQLNRNQVAQLALNTLKSPMVNLKDNTISWTDGDGQIIMSGGSRDYIVLSSREAYARAINDVESQGTSASAIGGWTVELGEHLYNGKLKLNNTTDAFQRPVRQWEFDGKEIGSYIKEELLVMDKVGEVSGKDLYDALGKTAIDDYTMSVALDGVMDPVIVRDVRGLDGKTDLGAKHNQDFVFDAADLNRSNKGSVGATGTGVLTQVFVDPNYENGGSAKDGRIWIAVINTYLARAAQDYDSRREELTLNAYSVTKHKDEYVALNKVGTSPVQIRLGVDEYPVVANASKDDSFLVTFAEGEVQTIEPAEVMSAVTISSFKSKDHLVTGGTKYDFTTTAGFDADALLNYTGGSITNLKDMTYNVYLDAYGNVIGVEEVDAVKNYVFLAAIDINDSNLINGTADAKAVFLDGTVDTIRVNLDKSDLAWYDNDTGKPGAYNKNSILNTWCTYTVNNNSVYTVKQVMDINAKGDNYTPNYKVGDVNNNDTGLAQYHQSGFGPDYTIDKKHITLRGTNAEGLGNTFSRVYGNEKTVYLTAELDYLTNQGGVWGVVKDIDTVTTGAENVNLTVWTDAEAVTEAENARTPNGTLSSGAGYTKEDYATKGVYTLYDDDGIVIAAVVAGEDEGSAKNLVYVHSGSIESESYNGDSSSNRASGDGMWTWTRKVIQNGQEVTLTEVSDGNSDLVKMQKYHWYQIKTNANGEVTGVYRLRDDNRAGNLPIANLDRYDDYALDYHYYDINKNGKQDLPDEIGEIAYTVQKGSSTVLYWNQDYIESILRMNGRTLYVATDDQTGFIVSSNVNWVVQQWDNNKEQTYIDEGTTAAGLKNMIDEINRRNTTNGVTEEYSYQVSAVIESGIASSVIIYFNENDYNRPDTGRPTTGEARLVWNDSDPYDHYWDLYIPAAEYNKYEGVLTTGQIANWLSKAGCTNISKTRTGWNFTLSGMDYTDQIIYVHPETVVWTWNIVYNETMGTASLDKAEYNVGDTVTVTAAPKAGYELDKITYTYNGKTYDITAAKTFVMPAANVTVTVTFKAVTVADEVTVTVPTGRANVLVDGAKVETVKVGDVISLDPAEALMATGGVTDNNNGTYTVTGDFSIVAKTGYSWNAFFSQWTRVTETGIVIVPSVHEWTVASVAASAKRFSLARAGEAEGDRTEIDTTDPNWLRPYFADPTKTFELDIVITRADGTTGTVTLVSSVSAAGVLRLNAAEGTSAADLALAIGAMAEDDAEIGAFEPKPSTPATESDKVVIENNAGEMTLYVYDPENNKATEAEVKGAIIKALKATKPNLTAEDIVIEGTTVTIGTDTYRLNQDAVEPLYKVTVGNNTQYVKDGGEYTGLAKTVNYVMPATKRVDDGTTTVAVTNGAFTFDFPDDSTKVDFEYAVALSVDGEVKDSEAHVAEKYTVWYDTGKTAVNEKWAKLKDTTTYSFIRAGVGIYVTAKDLVEGTTLRVTINGQDYTATVQSDGTANIQIANGFTAYGKTEDGDDLDTISFVTNGAGYTVYWDGVVVGGAGKQWEPGKEIPLTGISYDSKATYILGRVGTEPFGEESDFPGGKAITFTTDDVATEDVEFADPQVKKDLEKGIIRIYAAYAVNGGDEYTVTDAKDEKDADYLRINDGYYVAKDTKLKVTANNAQTLLKPKDAVGDKSEWTEAELVLTTSPAANTKADKVAIYEVTLNKEIGEDEFVAGQSATGDVGSFVLAVSDGKVDWNGIDDAYKVNSSSAYKIALDTEVVTPVAGKTDKVVVTWDDTATIDVLYKNMTAIATITEDTDEDADVNGTIRVTLSAKKGTEINLGDKTGTVGVLKVTVNGKLFYTINVTVPGAPVEE